MAYRFWKILFIDQNFDLLLINSSKYLYIKETLYINKNSKENQSRKDTNRYIFSLVSNIAVERSCFVHVELNTLSTTCNFYQFHHSLSVSYDYGFIMENYDLNVLYIFVTVPWLYEYIFKNNKATILQMCQFHSRQNNFSFSKPLRDIFWCIKSQNFLFK